MSRFSKRIALTIFAPVFLCAGYALATEARYHCDGGTVLVARFSPPDLPNGRVTLIFGDGREITLPQVKAADGGRYSGDGVEFWIKGRGATLNHNGASQNCSVR